MICNECGGLVTWRGPLSNLTHTECADCGAVGSQIDESDYSEELTLTISPRNLRVDKLWTEPVIKNEKPYFRMNERY